MFVEEVLYKGFKRVSPGPEGRPSRGCSPRTSSCRFSGAVSSTGFRSRPSTIFQLRAKWTRCVAGREGRRPIEAFEQMQKEGCTENFWAYFNVPDEVVADWWQKPGSTD